MEKVFSNKEKKAIAYIALVVMLISIMACAVVLINRNSDNKFSLENYHKTSYCIKKGDTLWELGNSFKQEYDDVRDWVRAVKEINGMTSSSIEANDYITILIAKD